MVTNDDPTDNNCGDNKTEDSPHSQASILNEIPSRTGSAVKQSVIGIRNLPNINPNEWINSLKKNSSNKRSSDASDVQVLSFTDINGLRRNSDTDESMDRISELIGHYGLWQFAWTFFLCLFQIPTTFHIFAFVFQAAERTFKCEYTDDLLDSQVEALKNISKQYGTCLTLQNSTDDYDYYDGESLELVKCERFIFDTVVTGSTLQSEWNLVCDRANLVSVVEMCFLAGAALGSIGSGWVSDKFGRRHTLMIFATIQMSTGTILAFVSSLEVFMALRFVIGFASMAVTNIGFVLCVELVSGRWRTIIGILDILPVAISYIFMAGIAYLTRDWRTTQLVMSSPWIVLLFFWFYLPESPRWLLAKGRIDELCKIIECAARWNKLKLPTAYEKSLHPPAKITHNISFMQLFTPEYRRITFLMIIVWFSVILLYFGITLHMNNLGGDIYMNAAMAGSVEAISICLCILVVLKLGLKFNLVMYMLLAGAVCLMVNFIPNSSLAGIITLAMIGKCTTGATNALIPTFTALQYPTTMRTLSVGIGNFAAGVALILVPYLWLLERIDDFLPMTVMGVFGIIGSIGLLLMNNKKIDVLEENDHQLS